MATELIANGTQNVAPNAAVIWDTASVSDGAVYFRPGSGAILLPSRASRTYVGCGCNRRLLYTEYLVEFHGNVAVPENGTVGPISFAVDIEGETYSPSIATSTPAATLQFNNIGASIIVRVPAICRCVKISMRNVGENQSSISNPNMLVTFQDVRAG